MKNRYLFLMFLTVLMSCKKDKYIEEKSRPNSGKIEFVELKMLATIRTAAYIKMDAGYLKNTDYTYGVAYSEIENFQLDNSIKVTNNDTITYQLAFKLTGLQPGTKYYFKGIAKKNTDANYTISEEKSFTTLDVDTLGSLIIEGGVYNAPNMEMYNGSTLVLKLNDLPYSDLFVTNNENYVYYSYLYENLGEIYMNGVNTGNKMSLSQEIQIDCNAGTGNQIFKVYMDGLWSEEVTMLNVGNYTPLSTTITFPNMPFTSGGKVILSGINTNDLLYDSSPYVLINGQKCPLKSSTENSVSTIYFMLPGGIPVGHYSPTLYILCHSIPFQQTLNIL